MVTVGASLASFQSTLCGDLFLKLGQDLGALDRFFEFVVGIWRLVRSQSGRGDTRYTF